MYLNKVRSKNSVNYYVCSGVREKGKVRTFVVARLGNRAELSEKLGTTDESKIEEWCREEIKRLESKRKEEQPEPLEIKLTPGKRIEKGEKVNACAGFMALQQVLYSLGFKELIGELMKGRRCKYDLEQIIAHLVYARVLDPKSKLSTYGFCKEKLLDEPEC